MPDDMELSPETKRLIEELGSRIAGVDSHAGDAHRYRTQITRMGGQVPPAADELTAIDPLLEAMEKVRDVEAEIEHESDEDRLRYLRELRQFMMLELKPSAQRRALKPPRVDKRREELLDYLGPAINLIARREHTSIWLHGDNARERHRAVGALSAFIAEMPECRAVEVDFHRRPGTANARGPGFELMMRIRQSWDRWGKSEEPSYSYTTDNTISNAFRNNERLWQRGVFVVLSEFPARRRNAAPFLAWLRSQLGVRGHLIINTERPPAPAVDIEIEPIECVSRATRTGRRIAELRRAKGWTRPQLADRAEMPVERLALIENGLEGIANEPGHREFEYLANALGVQSGTFLA